MGRLLPFGTDVSASPEEPRVLDLDDEASEEALAALSSGTARRILSLLYEEPRTAPELRDEVDTSLQNVHYHLERLEDADLVRPAATGYSEKGTEMSVYAPASEALVLFAGREHERSRIKSMLLRMLGAVGLLAGASLLVRVLLDRFGDTEPSVRMTAQSGGDAGGGADAGTEAAGPTPTPEPKMAVDAAEGIAGLDPALAFFLGGLFVLAVVGVYWVYRERRTVE